MTDPVEAIARAVLYEGYLLYPYRPSSVKNRVRWTFGGLFPRDYAEATGGSERWQARTECVVLGQPGCRLAISVRFLRVIERQREDGAAWEEAMEQCVSLGSAELERLRAEAHETAIRLPAGQSQEAGTRREWQAIDGLLRASAQPAGAGADRVAVAVSNLTPMPGADELRREQATGFSMASAHIVLRAEGGRFVSLTDPPAAHSEAAAACRNDGVWPVLVGDPATCDTVLASPIILEDFPRVAEESPGDLYDSTEIDEILTLRILTMTEDEKEEIRRADERGRRILERTESLTAEDLMRLHGAVRSLRTFPPEQDGQ